MKKHLFILNFLLISFVWGQTSGFNYKALLSENAEALVNQPVVLQFTLMDIEDTAVYVETHSTTTDENGIVNVNIGEGTVISGDFSTLDWDYDYSLKVEIDTGNGFQDFGTTAFKYVPYAKYAEHAGNTFSGDYNDLVNTPDFTGWDTDASDDVTKLNDLTDAYSSSSIVSIGTIMPNTIVNSVNIGIDALPSVNSGSTNVAVGYRTLYKTTYSIYNTAIGSWALSELLSGGQNTAIGIGAMGITVTGNNNTVVGFDAARSENMGDNNVIMGYHAGFNASGTGNVFLGYEAGYNETGSNKLYIANSSTDEPLIGGDFDENQVVINGDMKVANKLTATDSGTADMKAYIYGNIGLSGYVYSSSSSDGFTVTHVSTGKYEIDFQNESDTSIENYIVVATISNGYQGFISTVLDTDYFEIRIENKDGTPGDKPFNFVVYKK